MASARSRQYHLHTLPDNAVAGATRPYCLDQLASSLRDRAELRLVTLAPISRLKDDDYWEKNYRITADTLNEDFVIGESVQAGLTTGANEHMTFGRFEGALPEFNRVVKRYTSPQA